MQPGGLFIGVEILPDEGVISSTLLYFVERERDANSFWWFPMDPQLLIIFYLKQNVTQMREVYGLITMDSNSSF